MPSAPAAGGFLPAPPPRGSPRLNNSKIRFAGVYLTVGVSLLAASETSFLYCVSILAAVDPTAGRYEGGGGVTGVTGVSHRRGCKGRLQICQPG